MLFRSRPARHHRGAAVATRAETRPARCKPSTRAGRRGRPRRGTRARREVWDGACRWSLKNSPTLGILQGMCRWIGWVQYLVCASEKYDSTLTFQSQPPQHTQKPESPTTSEIQTSDSFLRKTLRGSGIRLQYGVVVEDLHAIMCANTKLFTKDHAHN